MEHISCNPLAYRGLPDLSYSSVAMTSAERIGANIREWRNRRRMTQAALGELIGSDGPRVGRIEKGAENPTVETLDKLAAALQIELHDLTVPRPEEEPGRDESPARDERSPILQALLDRLDQRAPAEDSIRGDILRAQDALGEAVAALNRALRREGSTGDAPPLAAKTGR